MAADLEETRDPDRVATQVYEDLHRGLAQALETTGSLHRSGTSIHFPYSQETLQALFYTATRSFSLPLSYTWGTEGPYFYRPRGDSHRPRDDRIGATQFDFREIAGQSRVHYPVGTTEWATPDVVSGSWYDFWRHPTTTGEYTRPPVQSEQARTRSPLTPSLSALERYFISQLRPITRTQQPTTPKAPRRSEIRERTFRLSLIADRLPVETDSLYPAALRLANRFQEMHRELDAIPNRENRQLGEFDDLAEMPSAEELPHSTRDDVLVTGYTKTILNHTTRSNFLASGQQAAMGMSPGQESRAVIDDIVELLEAFFDVVADACRFIMSESATIEAKHEILTNVEEFYMQRAWPLIATSVGIVEAKGPRSSELMKDAQNRWVDYYDTFEKDLLRKATAIQTQMQAASQS